LQGLRIKHKLKNPKTQTKTILVDSQFWESLLTAHVYHAPSPEDPSPSDEPPNLPRSTDCKLEEMKSQNAPAREEHLPVREHHALVYGESGKTRLVAAEVEEDDEHPGWARDMQRMMGNHRSSFKKGSENRARHLIYINDQIVD
jgi:hypothetical protein